MQLLGSAAHIWLSFHSGEVGKLPREVGKLPGSTVYQDAYIRFDGISDWCAVDADAWCVAGGSRYRVLVAVALLPPHGNSVALPRDNYVVTLVKRSTNAASPSPGGVVPVLYRAEGDPPVCEIHCLEEGPDVNAELQQENSQLQEQIQQVQQSATTSNSQNVQLQQENSQLQEQNQQIETNNTNLAEMVQNLQAQIQELQATPQRHLQIEPISVLNILPSPASPNASPASADAVDDLAQMMGDLNINAAPSAVQDASSESDLNNTGNQNPPIPPNQQEEAIVVFLGGSCPNNHARNLNRSNASWEFTAVLRGNHVLHRDEGNVVGRITNITSIFQSAINAFRWLIAAVSVGLISQNANIEVRSKNECVVKVATGVNKVRKPELRVLGAELRQAYNTAYNRIHFDMIRA